MRTSNLALIIATVLPASALHRQTSLHITSFLNQNAIAIRGGSSEVPSSPLPLTATPQLSASDAPLISDIEMLSDMLAEVVLKENPTVYDYYTRFRKLGMDRAANPDDTEPFECMKQLAIDINPRDTLGVMKTFCIALNLVNAAEVHHRMRLIREGEKGEEYVHVGPLPMVEDGIRGTMEILLEEGNGKDKIFERLVRQKNEIVLTAHPTEVNRKTILRKCKSCCLICCCSRPTLCLH
jgi:phosphoenolpyruvate carboxylase